MIVCVCNNVSDRTIRQAVNGGMTSMAELRNNFGVAACCGKCGSCARQIVQECLKSAAPARPSHALHMLSFHPNASAA
ncbi:(2Fe-2S)-binding protein [Herbaspirillum sp. RTI4]|nr:(2Fe-2S)-binding protein [Herbaspirillum sp. RTI4]MDY7576777.1 (2Fe-2S)-binding protein [Herbaspirillum sp. RTI4]MEA9981373.1 (2Fe-2S)-binding protein [Herbaspirillum sp. RTI4]